MTTQARGETIPTVTLGWRLRIALGHAEIKVEDMAARLGVSRQTLSRWMTDTGTPPRRAFLKLWAVETGVSLAWLEHGEGGGATPPTGGQPVTPNDQLAALTAKKRGRAGGTMSTGGYPLLDAA